MEMPSKAEIVTTSLQYPGVNLSSMGKCFVLEFEDYVPWNNPHDVIKLEVYVIFQLVVSGVYLPFLFLISTPTNILCMVVFYKQGLKERINLCVFGKSLFDFIFITHAFLQHADTLYMKIVTGSRYSGILGIFLRNKLTGILGFSWASAFVTMVIACERCVCVVSPIRSHLMLKTRTTAAVIVVASIVIVGLYCIEGARWTVACFYDPVANTTTLTAYTSDFYLANPHLVDTLEGVVYGVILPVFCVTVVATTTVITAVKLKQTTAWREQRTSSACNLSIRDVTLTRMLIGMAILFMFNIPGICFRMAMPAIPELSLNGRYRNSFHLLFFLHQFFAYTDSSFSFFVYYRYGTKFREKVTGITRPCLNKSKTESLPISSQSLESPAESLAYPVNVIR